MEGRVQSSRRRLYIGIGALATACCLGVVTAQIASAEWCARSFAGAFLLFAAALWAMSPSIRQRWLRFIVSPVAVILFSACGVLFFLAADRAAMFEVRVEVDFRTKTLCGAIMDYKADTGHFPNSLQELVAQGRVRDFVLSFPSQDKATTDTIGYCYVSNVQSTDPPDWPILFEAGDVNVDGACVYCTLSGETRWTTDAELLHLVDTFKDRYAESHGYQPIFAGDCLETAAKSPP